MNTKQLNNIIRLFDLDKNLTYLPVKEKRALIGGNIHLMVEDYKNTKLSKKKILKGASIIDVIKSTVKSGKDLLFNNPVFQFLQTDMGKYIGKKAYQIGMNQYRKKYCNGLARPLLPGEYHPLCQNYTGPGTRMDLPEVRNFKPYPGGIDECSRIHDESYYNLSKTNLSKEQKALKIHQSDLDALKCYSKHKNDKPYYQLSSTGIGAKYLAEQAKSIIEGKPGVFYGGKYRVY